MPRLIRELTDYCNKNKDVSVEIVEHYVYARLVSEQEEEEAKRLYELSLKEREEVKDEIIVIQTDSGKVPYFLYAFSCRLTAWRNRMLLKKTDRSSARPVTTWCSRPKLSSKPTIRPNGISKTPRGRWTARRDSVKKNTWSGRKNKSVTELSLFLYRQRDVRERR